MKCDLGKLMVDTQHQMSTKVRLDELDRTIRKSQDFLLSIQDNDGYWWGELKSNPTMEAEFLLLTHFLGVGDNVQWGKLANYIIQEQREDGSWGQYYEAPGDLSTSIECYFALKLAGISPDELFMSKAKDFILSKGGVPEARIFTKIWLALFGQWEWHGVPVMPPEIMLFPDWLPINIYEFSSWARATIVPLLIVLDSKPVQAVPDSAKIDELYPLPRATTDYSLRRPSSLIGWESFFYTANQILRLVEQLPWRPTRERALRKAEEWVIAHQEADGSWGGIQPPWVYSLLALKTLGYPLDHPAMAKGIQGFRGFSIEENETLRVQACVSPLWDTCLAMIALSDSGLPSDHPSLVKAAEYLLDQQVLTGGDWQVKAKDTPPGGWAFEFENNIYPDLDDTAEIVMAIDKVNIGDNERKQRAIDRALRWILGMQSHNGGWASFDKNNTKQFIARIPFADFGETVDPPSVDVTAHILEMFGQLGYTPDHPALEKSIEYMMANQEPDGAWFGRWGVNYIYGIGAVLPALKAMGRDMDSKAVRLAIDWLLDKQNPDGGWGENCASYVDPAFRGKGHSTASQTAWAILSLIAANKAETKTVTKAVEYLTSTQKPDGTWDEPWYTGTGFPGYGIGQPLGHYLKPEESGHQGPEMPAGFMINYTLYRNYWPLTALGRYQAELTANLTMPK